MAKKNYNKMANDILRYVGGPRNVENAINCMTRLRITVKTSGAVNEDALKKVEGVMQLMRDDRIIQVVLGPGVAKKVADEFNELVKLVSTDVTQYEKETGTGRTLSIAADWRTNKSKIKEKQKRFGWLSRGMKHLANIFTPLIPAIISAGLFAALTSIMKQACGGTEEAIKQAAVVLQVFYYIFTALSISFTSYLTVACGYNAAKEFGATPMLGLTIGAVCAAEAITKIAILIGLYDPSNVNASILMSGKGGVIGVILACLLLSYVEKFLHKHMPNSLDTVLTPFLSMLIVGSIYIFGIMIVAGFISDGIAYVIGVLTMNDNVIVRIIVGFFAAALFLPLVMTGMHHGLVAIYSVELAQHGFVSLYPALAMAGAGQVGAAIALYIKARRVKNKQLRQNIAGSIIPGICGVGEPLIYSVTLPLGLPFLTAGLGAGIGGAFVMAFRVGSTTWGPSGIVAIPLMTNIGDTINIGMGYGLYTAGLFISAIAAFFFTYFIFKNKRIMPAESSPHELAFKKK